MKPLDVKNLFKKIKREVKTHKRDIIGHPYRDWQIVIAFFFLANVLVVYFNLYLFNEINAEMRSRTSVPINVSQLIDQKSLNSIVTEFQNKAAQNKQLQTAKNSIADPSL